MISQLLLQTGGDIPFPDARLTVHNPRMEEIGFIGEESFHPGCQFLNFSSKDIKTEDKIDLEGKSDFDIFMSIMLSPEKVSFKNDAKMVLTLLFPEYSFSFENEGIILKKNDGFKTSINRYNFDTFKEIITSLFCLNEINGKQYQPNDGLAKKIAEKLNKRKTAQSIANNNKNIDLFSRYISILTVGQKKNVNDFNNYTVYQLNDEFKRFQLKQNYDMYIKAKMAGAQDLEEVDNWMENLHS